MTAEQQNAHEQLVARIMAAADDPGLALHPEWLAIVEHARPLSNDTPAILEDDEGPDADFGCAGPA